MRTLDRRLWLLGVGALCVQPIRAEAAPEGAAYDYLFLDLKPTAGAPPSRTLSQRLQSRQSEISEAGGRILGLFTPQLGWRSRQAALLVGWSRHSARRKTLTTDLARLPGVASVQRDQLSATARPVLGETPRTGGIYVHRWFTVARTDVPEFIELSVLGWRDFEARFETRIFGLFTAEAAPAERRQGLTRLLLITRYRDHGVWQASRDPSTPAMAAFARRQQLTRDSWAASSLLTPLPV